MRIYSNCRYSRKLHFFVCNNTLGKKNQSHFWKLMSSHLLLLSSFLQNLFHADTLTISPTLCEETQNLISPLHLINFYIATPQQRHGDTYRRDFCFVSQLRQMVLLRPFFYLALPLLLLLLRTTSPAIVWRHVASIVHHFEHHVPPFYCPFGSSQ